MKNSKREIYRELRLTEPVAGVDNAAFSKGKRPILFISDLAFSPPTDVWETEKEICVVMEIADLRSENIKIVYSQGYLVIEGRRSEPEWISASEITKFHKKEIDYGNFRVKVKMNTRISREKISARYKNGMLSISLLKNIFKGNVTEMEIPVVEE
jgi:HSP20 family molecular chaperone IbpA